MNDKQIIDLLWHYGHFRGRVDDPSRLTLWDKETVAALQSYQELLGVNLDSLTQKHHGRVSVADGVAGPATRELFTLPRCEVPDYGMGAKAIGSGSWPEPCQKAGVKVHVAKSGMPSAITGEWPSIVAKVFAAYGGVGLRMREVSTSDQANILVSFASFFGGTIGIAEFNGESCSDRVTCKLSRSYVGHNAGLLKHEMGHNCNLSHTRGGTMNPSILPEADPVSFKWLPTDPSYSTLKRYFGGTPIDGTLPPVDPLPPPAPDPAPGPSRPFRDFIRWLLGW